MKIYICSHKKFEKKFPMNYQIIYVGSKNFSAENGITDDIGDEIADKNEFYSELTALYWIWKNSNEDIVGLCHYRRFFKGKWGNLIEEPAINRMLSKADLIVPPKMWQFESVIDHFSKFHNKEDFKLTKRILHERYPEYDEAFIKIERQHWFYPLNMFVCRKNVIDQYCEWLFPLLFQIEEEVDLSKYDGYQKRLLGFLSERLFNVWIEKNQMKCREVNVCWIEKSLFERILDTMIQRGIMLKNGYLGLISKKTTHHL